MKALKRIYGEFGIRLRTSSPIKIDRPSIQTQFFQNSIEEYCNEIWDKAGNILTNDEQLNRQHNVEQLFQDRIEKHFNEVLDTVANLTGIDDRLSREEIVSTLYAEDKKSHSFSITNANYAMNMAGEKNDIVIAVMGVTGVGKSSFIKRMTGQDVFVGHGLSSGS